MHLTLQRWLHGSGLGRVSYHVRDVSGATAAAHEPTTPRSGASTTKLLTADAAFRVLGPAHRFRVEVVHDENRLYVRGCHPWLQPQDLVELVGSVSRHAPELALDDTRYPAFELPPGWSETDIPLNVQPVAPLNLREYFGADPARAVAEALAGLFTAAGHPTRFVGRAQARGDVVGRLDSIPLVDLVNECLLSSHNLMAEILGREIAIAAGLPPTFESMHTALTLGLAADTEGVHLIDACGLSTHDRVRADLLTHVLHSWLGPTVFDRVSLPLAGLTGTLSAVNDWFQHEPASSVRGYVAAKSGTHTDCVALAGYTFAPHRPTRVFAILVDGLGGPPPHLEVRREIEQFVRLVAEHSDAE